MAAPAYINQDKHAPSYTFGRLGSWLTRSRSAATPKVVMGRVSNGLHNTRLSAPDVYVAERVNDCTDRIPASPAANGINGPTLPVPVPEYTIDVTGAAVMPIGSVAGVALPEVPPLLVYDMLILGVPAPITVDGVTKACTPAPVVYLGRVTVLFSVCAVVTVQVVIG